MKPYQPVSCEQHSEFELLAMRRTQVVLALDTGVVEGVVADVFTHAGAEYIRLICADDSSRNIRLDQIKGHR